MIEVAEGDTKDSYEGLYYYMKGWAFIDTATAKNPDFIIQLGDLSHGIKTEEMVDVWNQFEGENFHVLGNHDSDNRSKEEVMRIQNMPSKYYSYDIGNLHFIVLDLNYAFENGELIDFGTGNYFNATQENRDLISPEQLVWLKEDLANTKKQCIIFSHQGIDEVWDGWSSPSRHQIREVLNNANAEGKKKVIACFSGHHHVDAYECIDDIHYFQINSASYYWMEEPIYSNGNMAEYSNLLYAFISVDLDKQTIEIKGTKSSFVPPTPEDKNHKSAELITAEIKDRKVSF